MSSSSIPASDEGDIHRHPLEPPPSGVRGVNQSGRDAPMMDVRGPADVADMALTLHDTSGDGYFCAVPQGCVVDVMCPPLPCMVTDFPLFWGGGGEVDLSPAPIHNEREFYYDAPLGYSPADPQVGTAEYKRAVERVEALEPDSVHGGVVRRVRHMAQLRVQTDSGANISVTNQMDVLHEF